MNATIYIDDKKFWRRVKVFAKINKISVSKLITLALKSYMIDYTSIPEVK